LRKLNDLEEKITLTGIVSAESDLREKSQKLTIKIKLVENSPLETEDKVLVTTGRYPEYKYGDKLTVIGKLEAPPVFESFNYQDYLKKDGIYSVMGFPEIELVGQNFGSPIGEEDKGLFFTFTSFRSSVYKVLFSFKNKFKEISRQFISPPEVGILEALIFGDEENISQDWKNKLNITGTRHIAAVSGMNITIISFLILNFLLLLGFWRNQAFYFTIILLTLYILMIGAPASAVRAGIMAGLFLLAQHLGRASQSGRLVVFAATFMLAINPLILRLDVGFQLSFLAILGMIYLQPFFSDFFKKIPNPKFFPVKTTFSATVSAQIFTLPILVYNFGYIPLLSPITNILIVPFLAPITILIFIFALSGMIFSVFGWILFWPTWLALTYITAIIDRFSELSFISVRLENVHWIWLIISYLILGFLTWRVQEKQKLKFLQY
jgi:competence protein ComEC